MLDRSHPAGGVMVSVGLFASSGADSVAASPEDGVLVLAGVVVLAGLVLVEVGVLVGACALVEVADSALPCTWLEHPAVSAVAAARAAMMVVRRVLIAQSPISDHSVGDLWAGERGSRERATGIEPA